MEKSWKMEGFGREMEGRENGWREESLGYFRGASLGPLPRESGERENSVD